MKMQGFRVLSGKYKFKVKLRLDKDGIGGVCHPPSVFVVAGEKGFLNYAGQPVYCRSCNAYGHIAVDCDKVVCRNCGGEGHVAAECTRGKRCDLCQATGHMARNCAKFPLKRRTFSEVVSQKEIVSEDRLDNVSIWDIPEGNGDDGAAGGAASDPAGGASANADTLRKESVIKELSGGIAGAGELADPLPADGEGVPEASGTSGGHAGTRSPPARGVKGGKVVSVAVTAEGAQRVSREAVRLEGAELVAMETGDAADSEIVEEASESRQCDPLEVIQQEIDRLSDPHGGGLTESGREEEMVFNEPMEESGSVDQSLSSLPPGQHTRGYVSDNSDSDVSDISKRPRVGEMEEGMDTSSSGVASPQVSVRRDCGKSGNSRDRKPSAGKGKKLQ